MNQTENETRDKKDTDWRFSHRWVRVMFREQSIQILEVFPLSKARQILDFLYIDTFDETFGPKMVLAKTQMAAVYNGAVKNYGPVVAHRLMEMGFKEAVDEMRMGIGEGGAI